MKKTFETQGIIQVSSVDDHLEMWMEAFLVERKSQGLAAGSMRFYRIKLRMFADYCNGQAITYINQITPSILREYLLFLDETGHNPGGKHAAYRTLRAFLNWYEQEAEPDGWKNPIKKVKSPKVSIEPLEPVPLDDVTKMIAACKRGTFSGDRDAAILLCLLDTGARAGEFLAINLADMDLIRGEILIRRGKGGKPRQVYVGKQSRRALRKYLKHRQDNHPALWVTRFSERLEYNGLRAVITRRTKAANLSHSPSLHDFRRAFALSMLRSGTDVFTLAKLMGHTGITVLQRYLKQTNQDTEAAHRKSSPADLLV